MIPFATAWGLGTFVVEGLRTVLERKPFEVLEMKRLRELVAGLLIVLTAGEGGF
jgi:hypothetical protein